MYALLPSAPEPGSGLSPDNSRKKRWALAALGLAGLAFAATVSQWATVKIYSNPPGVLDSTSYVPTGTVVPVSTPALSANGSRFTHWTVNGVRQVDGLGISMSALSLTITGSIDVVAQYTPETQDLDSDQVPDWYELLQYGNTLTGANDDTDNDGVTLYDEYVKGTQPRIHDSAAEGGIVEGGVSRRRSGTVPIRNAANSYFLSYTESSSPPGAIARQEWVPPGTSLTTTAPSLEQWGYKFGQWKLNGVRQESSSGVSLTQATFTITQDSSAVAEYVSTTQDSDGDSIPDWYEMQQYGNLLTGSGDDTDGDAVGFYDEYVAGTQPRIPDYASGGGILEGGIARRRSGTIQITTSPTYYTYTERSDPPGVVSVQSSHPAGTSITTSNQNGEVWGYRFTHWTINGVRQQAGAGFAVSQVTFNLAGNTVAQANFIATTQDLDSDQIPDWYEIQQYGAISNGPDSDTDGDGVVFYDEYIKGTQPLIHDSAAAGGIVEGGASRRRGASTAVDLSLLLEDFSLTTNTTQESNIPVKVGELTSTSSAIGIVVTANSGFEVRLVGGKYEVWTTTPTDYETTPILSIVLVVTNSRGTTINVSGTAGLTDNRFEDADGDGLTEAQEEDIYGTNDVIADFDGDGYRDGVEVATGTSPTDAHSFPWDGDIPLPQAWVKVASGTAKDLGFRGDRFVSVEQSSVDGSAWNTNSYGTNSTLFSFAGYGDGLWWGMGTNGLLRAGTNTDAALLSWQSRTSGDTNDLAQLAYGERTYLVRGSAGSGWAIRSTNGTNWSQVGTLTGTSNSRSLVFGGGRFFLAAGTEIRSMPSGGGGTWITNLVTNRPAGFLLTNLLARNGTVYSGTSLDADTNGRRSMVIGQSTNGTNWSFQTSSLTVSSGVELAEVAQGFYFATPTLTNGNAWFLVSSNASNWLKVTGSWTNGRVARGIVAGAGQLMVATDDGLYAGRFNRTGKDFTTTHENFNAALGTNWTIRKPFADSDVTVTGGIVRLSNRGTLILEKDFDGAFEASGRIRFAGSAYDSLRIVYASDKTSTSGSREMDKGLAISLSSRGGDWAPFGPKISLAVANYPDNGTVLGSADPTVAMNTWTDFRIVDDGKTIRMYWDDLVNPVITTNYSGSRRGYFAIYNREGSGGGSSISAGSVVEVERLTVRGAEVAKLAQTISFPVLSQKTYGDLPFSLGATATSGLPLTYASDNTGVAIVATNGIATIMGVGTSRITASQAGNTNYYSATTVERSLIVVARPITIRANDVTRGYGETNPALTSQVSAGSLVSGHTYTANLATTATSASLGANSPYPITVSSVVVRDAGGSDVTANYQVTTTNGNLYVPSLPQTISFPVIAAKTYGDPSFLLGATASSGLSVAYSVADPTVALVATNGAVTILRSGSTTITASQAGSSLYDPAPSITRTLTVSARPLSLRADDKSRMFGQANPALTYSVVSGSLISGHAASISLSTTATINSASSVTPYPISVDSVVIRDSLAQDVSVHYLLTLLNGGLTVTGNTPQITSTSSFSGTVGVAFSNTVTASGTAPITFAGSNLPTGLNIATNGLISGTPSSAGTNNATLRASNSIGSTNQNVTFTIAKGTPVISNWPTALAISYGQALSNSVLSGGSASVAGAFAWVSPTNRPNAGTNSQSVSFTPTATSNYNSVTSNINVVLNPAAAVLTWTPSPAASLIYPAPVTSTQLNATSSVAGTFDYNPTNGSVLNAVTNQLVATFRPTDTNSYYNGVTITNTVVVSKGSNVITFGSLPSKQVGDAAFGLTGSASSGLTVTYTSSDPNVATVSGSTVTIVGAGTTEIVASQSGNSNWNSASGVTNILTVLPRTVLAISGASVAGKIYDGLPRANVNWSGHTLVGAAGNHDVRLVTSGADATYDSANVGTGKDVSVTGLSLSGADAGRYQIGPALLLKGNISPAVLTIENLTVTEKRYDGTAVAPLVWGTNDPLSGYVNGETTNQARLLQDSVSGSYGNALVGSNKPVTLAGLTLVGTGKDNYTVSAPSNLTGTILKGWVEIGISNTNQVYGKTNRMVTTKLNLSVAGLGVRTNYWGTNGTVYGPSSNGPINAGSYGVEVVVEDNSQTYEGTNRAVLTIGKKSGVITAISDTIRAGTEFTGNRYTGSGFLDGDTITGTLATHLRSVTNTNPLVSYDPLQNQSGVYRILRGNVGDSLANNYTIEYREGTLTVLKASLLTEGSVTPLAAGLNYTLVVQNNGTNNPTLRAFGSNTNVVGKEPTILTDRTAEVVGVGSGAGANFGMGWTREGAGVVWWGGSSNQTFSNVVGMAAGGSYVGYVKENGTVGMWGLGADVPTVPPELTQTNTNPAGVLAVAAGQDYLLALRTNGSVMAWGTGYGANNLPAFTNAVGVAAGNFNGVVVKGDGTVQTWGVNSFGGLNIPGELTNRSTNTFVRAVSAVAGYQYTLVLRADGTVRGWGEGAPMTLPLALTNTNAMRTNPIVSLAVERHHAVAMQRDGTVTTWLPSIPPAVSNSLTLTVPPGLKGRVPMGGADSDGDGWANEAELRVGSDPMSRTSQPVKASFGVTFNYGSLTSSFATNRMVGEGTNRVVGTLQILDAMGRLEDGNQTEMTVELSEESLKTFKPVSQTNRVLEFKTNPVYDGVTSNNVYWVDVLVRDMTNTATLSTTLNVTVTNTAPQIIGTTSFSVNENVAKGTAVGMLQASETGVTWSLTNALFDIESKSGVIFTRAPIDYEALTNKIITLGVTVTDAGGATGSANVTITVADVVEMSFKQWLGGVAETTELLLKYAIGGASSPTGSSENMVMGLSSNKLTLTAVVRTNDPDLTIVGEAGANLSSWSSTGVSSNSSTSAPDGCQRWIYSVDRTNPVRQFLRLNVTNKVTN